MIGDIDISIHPVDQHTIAVAVSVKHWTLGDGWTTTSRVETRRLDTLQPSASGLGQGPKSRQPLNHE
jgi:hypothetical protein